MIDVFISYRQDERERMRPIVDGLRALNVEVWFDERLTPGKSFTEEIDELTRECKAQLVCWSPGSVRSDWVRGEAEIGRRRGVLVAAIIERCEPPPPFNMLHAEDLSGWTGGAHHPGWRKILEAIGSKLGRPGLAELSQLQSSGDAKAWKRWVQRYPEDPFADEGWAKAEELEVVAVRERQAQDRVVARQMTAREEGRAAQVSPPRQASLPGPNRLVIGGVIIAVAAIVISAVFMVTRPRPPVVLSPPATPPAPHVVPPAPRPVVASSEPVIAARRALDQITSRDRAMVPSDVLARRVLATTPIAALKAAAEAGHPLAQVLLGAAHSFGIGDARKDEGEAVRLYRLAAAQGDARGQNALGAMYATGRGGLTKDDVEAVRLYRLAAGQGHAAAQNNLGAMYVIGRGGLTKDDVEAVRLYRLAAAQGDASGQNNLGRMYENGRGGLTKDDVEAVRLYRLATAQGNASAQVNLGRMYENGRGRLTKDDVEAVRLYRLAAARGDALGQSNLGFMYANGRGGLTKDDAEAVRLYRLAADQGNALAQSNLGWMYENGHGVATDRAEAVRLYQLAARQGESTSQNNLRRLGETW